MNDLLKKYLEYVKDYNFSSLYNKWTFLSVISALLERKCWLNEELLGYMYPNLYVVFVGPPSSRKTTTAGVPRREFLRQMENGPIMGSNRITPSALIDEICEAGKLRYEHKTSPLYVIAGEFGVWLKDIGGGSIVDLLLDWYDSRQPGEIFKNNTKKWGKQELPNPALTLIGCTTPKEIMDSRILDKAGIGFTSRVIFVCEPTFIEGCTRFPPPNQKLRDEIMAQFYRINAISGAFTIDESGIQAREDVINRTNDWMRNTSGTTLLENYMARKPVQVRKVAMLLSAMRDSRRVIRAEDILYAEQLLAETEPTLPTAFGITVIRNDPGLASKMLDLIPYTGEKVNINDIMKKLGEDGQLPPLEEATEVLNSLIAAGRLFIHHEGGETYYAKLKIR